MLKLAVENTIAEATGVAAQIVSRSVACGGCINSAEIIKLADGRKFFLKSNSDCDAEMFRREADGLMAIGETCSVRVPRVVGFGEGSGNYFLVLEAIESTGKDPGFFENLGRQLAAMHRGEVNTSDSDTACQRFGFYDDNFIGSTPQQNDWHENWCEFFRERRLGVQFALAVENGYADESFRKLAERLQSGLEQLLDVDEAPSLLHGDLWSGNYMVDEVGMPVLIDPAVYFGHREAEFGMTRLFGGFGEAFYDAYNEISPLHDGAEERIEIYKLYHLLNHLNLFGASYRSACLEIMKRYA